MPLPLVLGMVVLAASGCLGVRGAARAELDPLMSGSGARAPLPDAAERAAGRIAAFVLADLPDSAAEQLQAIRLEDARRELAEESPTGIADNALDVIVAGQGRAAYARHARESLDRGGLDSRLERTLERFLASEPLAEAAARLREDRRNRFAVFFNRLSPALARLATGGVIEPWEAGRVVLSSWTAFTRRPITTSRQRQALHAYQQYLELYPDAPDGPEIAARVDGLRERLRTHLYHQARDRARAALDLDAPAAALQHLARAERIRPGSAELAELRSRAERLLGDEAARVRLSLEADTRAGSFRAVELLSLAALGSPIVSLDETLAGSPRGPGDLAGERRFLAAALRRDELGDEAFFAELRAIAEGDPRHDNMVRHARNVLGDPAQNPFAFYERARSELRFAQVRFVLLGSRARGAARRGLFRPLEWGIDLPAFATSLLSSPVRLTQLASFEARHGGAVLRHGEAYVARFPEGVHTAAVRDDLRARYARQGRVARALELERAAPDPDPERVREYREALADRMLEAAEGERRRDVRAGILRALATEYHDLPQGRTARTRVEELMRNATPQSIRLSRAFLRENPELVAPGTLALRPELFDGSARNGELDEHGVTLLGQTVVRIALEGRDPVDRRVPLQNFARFISLLEEVSYERLVTDARETPVADPQRDLFFERARLGLLDTADLRPSARSDFEFLSQREKHGVVKRAESVLPVEVVLRGGLEDFGLAAFPRVRTYPEREDAFLYE